MRLLFLLVLLLPFTYCLTQLPADSLQKQQQDTSATVIPYEQQYETDEEMNLFLMSIALVAVAVMAGMILITVALCALVLLTIAALIGAGVFSASVGVGIYKKSILAAVRTAVTLLMALVCAVGGAAILWLLDKLFELPVSEGTAALIGAGAGALGGVFASMSLFWLIKKLLGQIQQR